MMNRTLFPLLLAGAVAAWSQTPALIRGLSAMNAASRIPAGLPDAGIAPGARFVLLGQDLKPEAATSARAVIGDVTLDVTIAAVTERRIEAVLPLHAPTGTGTVIVTMDGRELRAPMQVVDRAFGIRSVSVKEGELARTAGTGLGVEVTALGVEVVVAGHSVPAAAVSRTEEGWEEIAFAVPEGVTGCAVPVAVRVSGRLSNFATMKTAACVPTEPETPEARREGTIHLTRTAMDIAGMKMWADSGAASFVKGLAAGATGIETSCTVRHLIEQDLDEPSAPGLDAGALQVAGPRGARKIERQSRGHYASEFGQKFDGPVIPGLPTGELYLAPGEYTVTGEGGEDVGPFAARLTVPEDVEWTNRGEFEIVERAAGLRVEWRGGAADQIVTLMGMATVAVRPAVGAMLVCQARGDAGSITVPPSMLMALPAASGEEDEAVLQLSVAPEKPTAFEAPGLDRGWAAYTQANLRSTRFQ
ncbi:MAG: hypothetical protein IT162_17780 [Bryobacterales bacterium]|nr:hypothetical protein [Bryobacterales bacterium]